MRKELTNYHHTTLNMCKNIHFLKWTFLKIITSSVYFLREKKIILFYNNYNILNMCQKIYVLWMRFLINKNVFDKTRIATLKSMPDSIMYTIFMEFNFWYKMRVKNGSVMCVFSVTRNNLMKKMVPHRSARQTLSYPHSIIPHSTVSRR